MSYAIAVLITVAAGMLAALGTFIIHSRIAPDIRQHYHDVGAVVFLQLGVIFAVLLAFVFNEAWDGYNSAALAIDLECGALHGTAMLASTLDAQRAEAVLLAERDYISSVVSAEWPIMAKFRTESIETDGKLRHLIRAVATLKPSDASAAATRSQMLSLLAQAHAQRETRIFQVNSGIPAALWTVLGAFSTILMMCVSFSSIRHRAAAAVVAAIFASGIVSILVLIRLLDYPFEGALALHAQDFTGVLVKVTNLLSSSESPRALSP